MSNEFLTGVGITVLCLFLNYAVKDVPSYLAWPGVAVGLGLILWSAWSGETRVPMPAFVAYVAAAAMVVGGISFQIEYARKSRDKGAIPKLAVAPVTSTSSPTVIDHMSAADDVTSKATASERPNPPALSIAAHVATISYETGAKVGGINWHRDYTHAFVEIQNPADIAFEDLDLTIVSDAPIMEATVHSRFADCKIGSTSPLPPTVALLGKDENGTSVAVPADATQTISVSNRYRLTCTKLPPHADIRIDLATVKMPDFTSQNFIQKQVPKTIEFSGSYMADGKRRPVAVGQSWS